SMAKKGAGGEESVVVPAQTEQAKQGPPRKRNPCPGIRCVGGRIYDPENGKTCHQCRQKTMDFAVACTQPRKKGLCPIHFCHKCLFNRYGENAEDMTKEAGWTCPKCRGICNCSFCRKKKGETPTGILAHAAKASGHSSVHDLLIKGSDMVVAAQTLSSLPKKIKKEHKKGNIKRALGTDDGTDGLLAQGDDNTGTDLNALLPVPISKKLKKDIRNESTDVPGTKIELPIGTPVTDIAGAELEVDDVGSALQFHEFCRTFAEVLKIRKGQPEKVLQVITGGGRIGREVPSVVADLHISLLSVIQEDREENPSDYSRNGDAWIIDTGKYISESTVISKELPVDCLSQGVLGYKKLSPSLKLHVLNFLCDEALSTTTLKNWVLKQHESATERKVAAREKFRAVKEKEKELKEKLTIK
uniref:DDT domain-containing protein n=1 Tax=Aegilops tauschii subsp. strangulata TaxID=200361 RepID=A0A453R8T6_AEGTS